MVIVYAFPKGGDVDIFYSQLFLVGVLPPFLNSPSLHVHVVKNVLGPVNVVVVVIVAVVVVVVVAVVAAVVVAAHARMHHFLPHGVQKTLNAVGKKRDCFFNYLTRKKCFQKVNSFSPNIFSPIVKLNEVTEGI